VKLQVRGACGHSWKLEATPARAGKILDGEYVRAYCPICYKSGKQGHGNKVRVTSVRITHCAALKEDGSKCGEKLNGYNHSGRCGACDVKAARG
jgi:hypothetical protein